MGAHEETRGRPGKPTVFPRGISYAQACTEDIPLLPPRENNVFSRPLSSPRILTLINKIYFMNTITVYTDGGARGNPGPAGAGVVIKEGDTLLAEVKQFIGEHQTNNWAEYEAVIISIGKLLELLLRDRDIEFRLDSLLVVEQLKGNWKIKEAGLKIQAAKVQSLLKDFGSVTFTHVPREENTDADRLVNEAIDETR